MMNLRRDLAYIYIYIYMTKESTCRFYFVILWRDEKRNVYENFKIIFMEITHTILLPCKPCRIRDFIFLEVNARDGSSPRR